MSLKDPIKRREYHRRYMRERFHNNPKFRAEHIARATDYKRRYIAENAKILLEFKADGCFLCDEKDVCCISAHHVGAKDFPLSNLSRATESIVAELKKCVPLCENCHRKLHAGRISLLLNTRVV